MNCAGSYVNTEGGAQACLNGLRGRTVDSGRRPVAAPTDGFTADNWWRSEGGFTCYATEYFKLLYYGLSEDRFWQGTFVVCVALTVGFVVVRGLRRRRVIKATQKAESVR